MPPKKINFNVVFVSGEDEIHPSSELNTERQGPLNQGWCSQKFCLFPNDLIIQFERKCVLKKVQLLSHQFLIASKIEFYIGDCGENDLNYETAKYTRLGYVELSPNERTDFRARELKSVHVDAEGTFLKFVLHKNFVNRQNLYNQVGLIAINIIGDNLAMDMDPAVHAAQKRPDYISPLDDLAFTMYQDPEISQIIRSLDKKKNNCVIAEKFDEAKRLKQAIGELYKIGERLARYDLEKRQAIEDEDYEKAKQKKVQMYEYRTETYRQLRNQNLIDYIEEEVLKKTTNQYNDSDSTAGHENYKELPEVKELETASHTSQQEFYSPRTNRQNTKRGGDNTYRSQQQQQQQFGEIEKPPTPYDDRVIPTLRNNNKTQRTDRSQEAHAEYANESEEQGAAGLHNGGNTSSSEAVVPDSHPNDIEQEMYDPIFDGTEEMTEREVREAALMNDILGRQIVTKLYSKNFQNREDAIDEAYASLEGYQNQSVEETKAFFRATSILVAKMCKDNVFIIFNNSLRLFKYLLNEFATDHPGIGKSELNYALERCLPVLVHRTGDTNARLRQRSHDYIVEMASYKEIKPLNAVPAYLTIPMKVHTAPRLALSQCEIVEELMNSLGIKENGLNVDNISKFCAAALEHNSGEVREVSSKILVQLYRESGSVVRKYLPQDNEMNRRNKKYRSLFEAFDSIDGKGPPGGYENLGGTTTPRFGSKAGRDVKTPNRTNKTPRSHSIDRKTPLSMADESEYNPDNTCMFCNEVNEKFVKQGFEMHYWKSCPMLKQCHECKQVIEVAVQTEHLLTECQLKNNYKKCPRCTEAVNITNAAENEHHFKKEACKILADKKGNRCPLCHIDIGAGEEVWKEHLMSPTGCTKNNRIDNKTSATSPSGTTNTTTTSKQQTGAAGKNASRK